ncbi:hypothetical protein J6590_103077 [Homalodisca vitripennis]|nr:hypothetical protein J6590_103077 [Homalodisca vitripennis]
MNTFLFLSLTWKLGEEFSTKHQFVVECDGNNVGHHLTVGPIKDIKGTSSPFNMRLVTIYLANYKAPR